MNIVKRIFYTFSAFCMVYFTFKVSVLFYKVGFKSAAGELFLITLCIYMSVPLIKLLKNKRLVHVDVMQIVTKINKTKIAKNKNNNLIFYASLKAKDLLQESETLLITEKGVFNIVYFNEYSNAKTFEDCIESIRKTRKIIGSVIKEDNIYDIIITSKKQHKKQITNHSVDIINFANLDDYIDEIEVNKKYNQANLYDKIYPIIYKTQDINKEDKVYQAFLDNRYQFRSRLAFSSISFMLFLIQMTFKL